MHLILACKLQMQLQLQLLKIYIRIILLDHTALYIHNNDTYDHEKDTGGR